MPTRWSNVWREWPGSFPMRQVLRVRAREEVLDHAVVERLATQLAERAAACRKALGRRVEGRATAPSIYDRQSHQMILPDRTQKCDLHPSRNQTDGCKDT
jgi:hypothetical protein